MKLLFLLLFLIPSLHYDFYILLSAIPLLFIFEIGKKEKINNVTLLLLLITIILLVRSVINHDFQELRELIKISFVVVILSGTLSSKYRSDLIAANHMFFVILFTAVVIQWIDPFSKYWAKLVNIFYNEGHYVGGIRTRLPRAVGIMSNIVEASVYFCLNSIYSFYRLIETKKKIYLIFYILSIIGVVLTQSKTMLLIQVLVASIQILVFSKNWIKYTSAVLLFVSFSKIVNLLKELDQINRLLEVGILTSSMSFRLNSWLDLINVIWNSSALSLIFGIGRTKGFEYVKASTLDSDFFYMLQNFGLIGVIICIYFLIKYINKSLTYTKCVGYSLLCLLPSFLFLDIIFNPKIVVIAYLFFQVFKYENPICSNSFQRSRNY